MLGITELSKSYARKHNITVDKAHKIISSVLDEVVDAIYDFGGVQFRDVFTLEVKTRPEYTGVNPRDGGKVKIPKSAYIKARTGKKLKRAISQKYCD